MEKIFIMIASLLIIGSFAYLKADEVNVKAFSWVDHKVNYGFKWVEDFENGAKGIEYIYDPDNKGHGIGLSYIDFTNSYGNKTTAKGLVYRYRYNINNNLSVNSKAYFLHQKGYYKWQVGGAFDGSDNEFYTPMGSFGINYKGFTIDGLVLKDKISAFAFGYAWSF